MKNPILYNLFVVLIIFTRSNTVFADVKSKSDTKNTVKSKTDVEKTKTDKVAVLNKKTSSNHVKSSISQVKSSDAINEKSKNRFNAKKS